jgi:hypothetical protein
MALATHQTIQSLWQRFVQDELGALPAEQRRNVERQFETRFGDLLSKAGGNSTDAFVDLLGFGGEGIRPFGDIAFPHLEADFDESITPSQAHAWSQLYFIYQHEKMGVFRAVAQLQKLFRDGRIQIQSGPGARALYVLLRHTPLRYSAKDRAIAYMRVFNYGRAPRPAGAVINKNFHYQLVALMSSLAQYFRDLTIGEVIRGSGEIEQRPYGSIATVQRLAIDLRYALDRASYGNIVALTHETGLYLDQVLDLLETPDIKNSFGVRTRWELLERIANLYFGGTKELSHRAKMAEAGRRVLQWVASSDFSAYVDPDTFRAGAQVAGSQAEAWIAAYRLTEEGRRFPGVSTQLKWSFGLSQRREEAEELV